MSWCNNLFFYNKQVEDDDCGKMQFLQNNKIVIVLRHFSLFSYCF